MPEIDRMKFGTTWQEEEFDGAIAFNSMCAEFDMVMNKYPQQAYESFFLFAGRIVRLRIVGFELTKNIIRPFSHLQIPAPKLQSPELTIDLWDENIRTSSVDGTARKFDGGWHESTVQSHNRFIGQQLPHTFSCLDRAAGQIVASIAWHDKIFIYERAKPLARLLLNWHNDCEVQLIHAGLVARKNKGLLFVGKSGSGKSTTSLACIIAGFNYLSEDYVGLERRSDGTFVGYSLYNSVFLNSEHLKRFPQLAENAIRGRLPHEEKSVIILSQLYPQCLERFVPIRALVLPQVTAGSEAKVLPATRGEALLALGPSSLLQIPNRSLGVNGFQNLAALVAQIPCFRLELGIDLALIPQCLDQLLEEIAV